MPNIIDLTRKGEIIFAKVGDLQKKLRGIPNARSTFSVENGMEYCTDGEFSKRLVRAVQTSPSVRGNQASEHIGNIANMLEKCVKNLEECEDIVLRATRKSSWSPNLEEEMSVNWRLFCMHLVDASSMLDITELDISMMIGKPESSTVSREDCFTKAQDADHLIE